MENTILYENGDETIVDERITYLAKELGVDEEDIKKGYSDDVFEVTVDDEDREYLVVDEDGADKATREYIENIIDDIGIEDSFTDDFKAWLYSYAVDDDFLDDALYEEIANTEDDKDDYDNDEYEERLKYLRNLIDGDTDDKVEYFQELLGKKEFSDWVREHDAFDIDAIIDKCIDWDGRGHFLAGYDGDEIELADDRGYIHYYAYRTN